MPDYVLSLLTCEDDGASYQMAWHITEEFKNEIRARLSSPPHGEWMFTAEDNEKRKAANEGIGIGMVNDGP